MAHDDDLDERAVPLRTGVLSDCVEAEDALDEVVGDALAIRLVEVGELVLAVDVAAVVLEQLVLAAHVEQGSRGYGDAELAVRGRGDVLSVDDHRWSSFRSMTPAG